jgi:hypothetical protein
MEEYQKLKEMVDGAADDIMKAVGGNKAAGTRVRKTMQDVRNLAQDIRRRVLELRKTEEAPPTQSS